MKHKSEIGASVKSFVQFVETQFDAKVNSITLDNGAKFKLYDFYNLKGICIKCPMQKLHSRMALWRENITIS